MISRLFLAIVTCSLLFGYIHSASISSTTPSLPSSTPSPSPPSKSTTTKEKYTTTEAATTEAATTTPPAATTTETATTPAATTTETTTTPAATTTETATEKPTQQTCMVDLQVDNSKSHLGDIPIVPDHKVNVPVLNRKYVPLKSCKALYDEGFKKSGLYVVSPRKCSEFVVFCDMTLLGGGWTVIQRRVNNNQDFNQKYENYQNGFGDFTENFWLGLDKIHYLTEPSNELYIGMETFYDTIGSARYSHFSVADENDGYRLRVSGYDISSVVGDSMRTHNNQKFSTSDRDQDSYRGRSCAHLAGGGWWYNDCYHANLNGKYYLSEQVMSQNFGRDAMLWETWYGGIPLQTTVIAIRNK